MFIENQIPPLQLVNTEQIFKEYYIGLKRRQIISLPGAPTHLRLALLKTQFKKSFGTQSKMHMTIIFSSQQINTSKT
jgi:hypothetical protein